MLSCQFAGIVTALGPDTADSQCMSQDGTAHAVSGTAKTDLQIGDHVLGACRFGSYATSLTVPAQQVLHSCKRSW